MVRGRNLVVSVSVRAAHTSSTKPSEQEMTTSRRRGLSALWSSSRSAHTARNSAWHVNAPLATCLLRLRNTQGLPQQRCESSLAASPAPPGKPVQRACSALLRHAQLPVQ